MRITVLAVGKLRGAHKDFCAEYIKRITDNIAMREVATSNQKTENQALLAALPAKGFVVLLDEKGQDISSRDLAAQTAAWRDQGVQDLVFVIGGADGLSDDLKKRAQYTLGLGRKTWPHKLARVMLLEQLYRAQQINNGHPYHRD
jgi:23S rRNA (pseudouridine1915-N3)-methyltransferase